MSGPHVFSLQGIDEDLPLSLPCLARPNESLSLYVIVIWIPLLYCWCPPYWRVVRSTSLTFIPQKKVTVDEILPCFASEKAASIHIYPIYPMISPPIIPCISQVTSVTSHCTSANRASAMDKAGGGTASSQKVGFDMVWPQKMVMDWGYKSKGMAIKTIGLLDQGVENLHHDGRSFSGETMEFSWIFCIYFCNLVYFRASG